MTITKFLSFLLFISASSCISCEEKEWTTLPPETQTGANTFGCYVNGELFVKGKEMPFTSPRLYAGYERENKILRIRSYSIDNKIINIKLNEVEVNIPKPISEVYFYHRQYNTCVCFGGKETGEIVLTKLDTINCIVSGRFQFQGQCSDFSLNITGDSIVHVTNGRFDAKLNVYDNINN